MSVPLVGDLPWDAFDAYLFDIDGTLLNCGDAVHYFAFCEALRTLSGRDLTLEGVVAHGNTDVGILRDALTLAGVDEGAWRPALETTCEAMGRFVEAHRDEFRITVLPQVRELLTHLRARGAVLGVATGNLKTIGRAKLERVELLDHFRVGGWSDGFEHRTDVFRAATQQMRNATNAQARICVVGDTPSDILSAQANQLPVIAVATGIYSRPQLLEYHPDLCVGSLAELVASLP